MTLELSFSNWLLALSPMLAVLMMMLVFRASGSRAGGIGWFTAILVSVLFFGSGFDLLAIAQIKAILLSLDVLFIVWMALFLFHITDEAGAVRLIGRYLPSLTENRMMQSLLIGWVLVTFIQGTGGFGVPVAVCSPMLVSVGFSPVQAVAMTSLGDTWAVTFGSLGTSFKSLIAITGLPADELAPLTAVLQGAASFPSGMLVAVIGSGWKSFKKALFPVALLSIVMSTTQYFMVVNGLWTLGATGAGLVGLVVGFLLLRLPSYRKKGKGEQESPARLHNGREKLTWLPLISYALLVVLAFGTSMIKPVSSFLSQVRFSLEFPEVTTRYGWVTPAGPGTVINLFAHPGAILLYTCVLSLIIYKLAGYLQPGALKRIVSRVTGSGINSSLGILTMVGLASVMLHSGMTFLLAEGISANINRNFYPLAAPFIGALGAFITGSNTNSNVLFGTLQMNSAQLLNLSVPLILAAQSAGGSAGSVLAPAKVIVGCSTVGLAGEEAGVMRKIIGYGLIPIAVIALTAWVIHLFG